MRVIAWSENLSAERAAEFDVTYVSKQQLFEQADVLSVHLVLSERSRGMVDGPGVGMDEAHGAAGQHRPRADCR